MSMSACHGGDEPERAREDRGGKMERGVIRGNKSKMLLIQ